MKKIILILIIGLIYFYCNGQNENKKKSDSIMYRLIDSVFVNSPKNPTYSKLRFIHNCENAKIIAEQDIKNQSILILIESGINPIEYSTDKYFEKKYKITFFDYGDLPATPECMLNYNKRIFDYLTEKYGSSWRKEIRKDVYGFNE
jgi:hypothetical protein